jgi:hypothetical protein
MTPDEVSQIMNVALRYGFEVAVVGVVVFLLLKNFLPGYLSEKGKNLATREDVRAITVEVESVKNQYVMLVEELKAKHQLRLAAVERRLQAHQEAFTLWRNLLSTIHTEDVRSEASKCSEWWNKNCLYLEPTAREAFANAYHAASDHSSLLSAREVGPINENWNRIISAGSAILQAAQLTGLTAVEQGEIKTLEKNNHDQ